MSEKADIIEFLEAGIRAESLRRRAIANNIANLQTPRYRRVAVRFEKLLAKKMKSPGSAGAENVEAQLYRPDDTPVKSNGNNVNLETEVGILIKNSLRQKTYFRVLRKKYRQMELAIRTKE